MNSMFKIVATLIVVGFFEPLHEEESFLSMVPDKDLPIQLQCYKIMDQFFRMFQH